MSLFQKRSGGPFPEPVVSPFPGVSVYGGQGGVTQAMQIDAVWSCVRLLAESVAMMPLNAYTMRQGQRVPVSTPPLLAYPTSNGTLQDWLYQAMASMLLTGNAYGQIVQTDGNGYPTMIDILDPGHVRMRKESGVWTYVVKGIAVDSKKMWHVPAFLLPGSPEGLSPIQYAARTIGTIQAAEQFGKSFFEDGAHPSAVLSTQMPVNQEQAKQIKERFVAAVAGSREPAVLGQGLTYQAIQISPEESQFLATQQWGITKIARVFGVPPEMVGGSANNSMTYANVTQRSMDFLTYSVQAWLTRLENAIFPLLPGARHVRFDTSALVRLDEQTKWLVYAAEVNTGASTINELRATEGKAPVTWGDRPYLPGMATAAAGRAIQFGETAGSGMPAAQPANSNANTDPASDTDSESSGESAA